jgi:hypothetical protein
MTDNAVVYDKAKYHLENVKGEGLNLDQAFVHTAFYFAWLIENKLLSKEFEIDFQNELKMYAEGGLHALDVYKRSGGCLIDDMLNSTGNAFTKYYFDFEHGQYLSDYGILAGPDISIFAVPFTTENYLKLRPVIDLAFISWHNHSH